MTLASKTHRVVKLNIPDRVICAVQEFTTLYGYDFWRTVEEHHDEMVAKQRRDELSARAAGGWLDVE